MYKTSKGINSDISSMSELKKVSVPDSELCDPHEEIHDAIKMAMMTLIGALFCFVIVSPRTRDSNKQF